jgi:ribosomal protein S18 acetylase RimI-like enzyme
MPSWLEPELIFREDESTTVVISEEQAIAAGLEGESPSAWITLGADSDLAAVGFLGAVTTRLAEAGISCNVVSAFRHDHLFVPAARSSEAMVVLSGLQSLHQPAVLLDSDGAVTSLRPAQLADLEALTGLWSRCGLRFETTKVGHELQSCLRVHGELILVAISGTAVVGSIWATYDGRRGWIQRLATDPRHRGHGIGRGLLREAEARLARLGARKVNLLIEPDNSHLTAFYAALGYATDDLVFMERRLDSYMGA